MENFVIRDYKQADSSAVDSVSYNAFKELAAHYSDWEQFVVFLKSASSVAELGEMIVAEVEGEVIGAVTYIAPHQPKNDYFQQEWSIMRMLVVDPKARGLGVGSTLIRECLRRADRDEAKKFALHTTPLMSSALSLYLKHGFEYFGTGPSIYGVQYNIYIASVETAHLASSQNNAKRLDRAIAALEAINSKPK